MHVIWRSVSAKSIFVYYRNILAFHLNLEENEAEKERNLKKENLFAPQGLGINSSQKREEEKAAKLTAKSEPNRTLRKQHLVIYKKVIN